MYAWTDISRSAASVWLDNHLVIATVLFTRGSGEGLIPDTPSDRSTFASFATLLAAQYLDTIASGRLTESSDMGSVWDS
jgi:hypothetical protein